MKRIQLLFYFLFFSLWSYASGIGGFSISGIYTTSLVQSKEVAAVKGSHPFGIQLDWVKLRTDQEILDLCNCYPKYGINLGYINFDASNLLGEGYIGTVFIEPQFKITNAFFISVKAQAGFVYGTKKYNQVDNPLNLTYSSDISNYLALGFSNHFYLNPQIAVFAGLQMNHISNGGINDPNNGLNFPGISLGATYFLEKTDFSKSQVRKFKSSDFKKVFSVAVYYSATTTSDSGNKKYPIYGMELGLTKRLNGVLLWKSGLDAYKDNAVEQKLIQDGENPTAQYRLGLSTGIGFLMGNFQFSSSLGLNVFDSVNYYAKIFHRHELMYAITDKWGIGLNLKVHSHIANFMDIRIKYNL